MSFLSYPGSMKSFCCHSYSDIFIEKDHVLDSLCSHSSCLSINSTSRELWNIYKQWNPLVTAMTNVFTDCKWKIVNSMIGSDLLVVGMERYFSWLNFSHVVGVAPEIYYSSLWQMKHCSYFPAVEFSNSGSQSSWSTFSFFLLLRGHCYFICVWLTIDTLEEQFRTVYFRLKLPHSTYFQCWWIISLLLWHYTLL